MAKTFTLWATVLRHHDGDTTYGYLDCGYHLFLGSISDPIRLRCALINAPELDTTAGIESLRFAQQVMPPGDYQVISYRPDQYGRPLLDYMLPGNWLFSQAMIQAKMATPRKL